MQNRWRASSTPFGKAQMRRTTTMPSFDETLVALAKLLRLESKAERDRRENLEDATMSKAFRDERDAALLQQLESMRREKRHRLDNLVRYPPFHDRHFSKLNQFHDTASRGYEKSVFIMTKFPEGTSAMDLQLEKVIAAMKGLSLSAGAYRVSHPMRLSIRCFGTTSSSTCSAPGVPLPSSRASTSPNSTRTWQWSGDGCGGWVGSSSPLSRRSSNVPARMTRGGLIEQPFEWDDPDALVRSAVKAWPSETAAIPE